MFKFTFYYNALDGKKGHKTIKASNKQDAIKKAFDFIKKTILQSILTGKLFSIPPFKFSAP